MFINKIIDTLTGQPGRRAGESLKSVTKNLHASRILDHERYGSRIVLVDTPGFDDLEKSDLDILKLIGNWLKKTYIYLHLQSSRRNNNIFTDTKNEYYYRGSCMCNESLICGCPQHPTAISSCSKNSPVPALQRRSFSPPRCGISSPPRLVNLLKLNGSST